MSGESTSERNVEMNSRRVVHISMLRIKPPVRICTSQRATFQTAKLCVRMSPYIHCMYVVLLSKRNLARAHIDMDAACLTVFIPEKLLYYICAYDDTTATTTKSAS